MLCVLGLCFFQCHYSLTPSDILSDVFHLNPNQTFSALHILPTLCYLFSAHISFFLLWQDMRNLMYSFILLCCVENVTR